MLAPNRATHVFYLFLFLPGLFLVFFGIFLCVFLQDLSFLLFRFLLSCFFGAVMLRYMRPIYILYCVGFKF
jgi:hypothetical protein